MNDKITNLKEKFRLALTSTAKVISDDFDLIDKSPENDKKKDLYSIEIDNLTKPSDFIKLRAETDSSALKKRFSKNGKILSRSLSDSALITALSNDYTFENAMVEYLKIEGVNKNDLIITISSSGNSPNIVSVLNYCSINNITTLGLSGLKEDNKSVQLSTYSLFVPIISRVMCSPTLVILKLTEQITWNRLKKITSQ